MTTFAHKYISSLRNEAKRHYAVMYAEWLAYGGDEPEHGKLSAMAAQSVRMRLTKARDDDALDDFNYVGSRHHY